MLRKSRVVVESDGFSQGVIDRIPPPWAAFQKWKVGEAAQLSRLYERGKLHSMGRMTLITGGERRRRWSDEDRARILAAIAEPGAVVADVARREDVCTSLVYKWRRAARREQSAAACGFSPVIIETAPRGGDVTGAAAARCRGLASSRSS